MPSCRYIVYMVLLAYVMVVVKGKYDGGISLGVGVDSSSI
jgi:hypothetical protein